jgi:oligopeptide/dipeptide ABC transporter ATP-binding protein
MSILLELCDINKSFITKGNNIKACDDINLKINSGEILGLVGESGSGKSTVANLILGLERPDTGDILDNGKSVLQKSKHEMRNFRRNTQAIFQYPLFSLDSKKTIGWIIAEPLEIHKFGTKEVILKRVFELLDSVALSRNTLGKYPHELSGGQLQRVNIARALALNPKLLICDEPVSALDVSIQAQIVNLFLDIQKDLDIAMLFISHDLAVVRYLSDRIAVMYGGKLVELGNTDEICNSPQHPYTKVLLGAANYAILNSDSVAHSANSQGNRLPQLGCPFAPRCELVINDCESSRIVLREISNSRSSACIRNF